MIRPCLLAGPFCVKMFQNPFKGQNTCTKKPLDTAEKVLNCKETNRPHAGNQKGLFNQNI